MKGSYVFAAALGFMCGIMADLLGHGLVVGGGAFVTLYCLAGLIVTSVQEDLE